MVRFFLVSTAESQGTATTDDIGAVAGPAGISRHDEIEEGASAVATLSQSGTTASSSSSTRFARFPRFLRRTHSASAAGPEVPAYALFLRSNKRVSLIFLPLDVVSLSFSWGVVIFFNG